MPDKSLLETLKVLCESPDNEISQQVTTKVKLRKQEQKVVVEDHGDDGDKEYYFDCAIFDQLDDDNKPQPDLMDFVSSCTVN